MSTQDKSEQLRRLRVLRGFRTAEAFAKATGMNAATYRAYENGLRPVTIKAAQAMAGKLGVDWKALVIGETPSDDIAATLDAEAQRPKHAARPDPHQPPRPPLDSLQDLPILGHVRGGPKGDALFMDNGTPVAWTYRPANLVGVTAAYAVYVVGDSMHPRYRPGELVYVNPTTPPRQGDDVVIQQVTGEAFVKEFVGRSDKIVRAKQHNPSAGIEYPAEQVANVHVVVFASRVRI